MNILIVLNQTDTDTPPISHDYLIGVDGGCEWCLKNNQKMDLAIGDFDSLSPAHFLQLKQYAGKIEQHSTEKDQTDLELAITAAMQVNPCQLNVYGVWGGRLDHSLANLLCLAEQTQRVPIYMPGRHQFGFIIKSKQVISIKAQPNHSVSLLALGDDCYGISNKGFKYPLTDAILKHGSGRGLSNLTTDKRSEIALDQGRLLVLTGTETQVDITTQDEDIPT